MLYCSWYINLHFVCIFSQEYQNKMQKCLHVKETLKSHIASLPDLAAPTSEGLAPLPSAGDLFS